MWVKMFREYMNHWECMNHSKYMQVYWTAADWNSLHEILSFIRISKLIYFLFM